jgi:hypothetical protein
MKSRLQKALTMRYVQMVMLLFVFGTSNLVVAQTPNITRNGNFSSGSLTNWTTYLADFAGVKATFAVTNGEAAITNISNAGAEVWHVQLFQVLTTGQLDSLKTGRFYKISFDARSPLNGRQLRMYFGEEGGDFRATNIFNVTLSVDKKNYTTTFALPEKYAKMKLGFEMGLSNADVFIDNVSLSEAVGAGLSLPVTFDNASIDYKLSDFGGNASEIVVDPTNSKNFAVKSTKTAAAELWAGTTVGQPEGFLAPISFKADSTKMSVRVWSPHANIPVRLKVEDAKNPAISVETEAMVTAAEKWQTLVFDFSKHATGTAPLNLANKYNKASIFFNFGKTGAEAGAKTYFWDSLTFGDKAVVPTSLNEDGSEVPQGYALEQNYPNPFNPSTSIQFSIPTRTQVQIDLFNLIGHRVMSVYNAPLNAGTHQMTVDASALSSGTYIYRLKTEHGVLTQKMTLIK